MEVVEMSGINDKIGGAAPTYSDTDKALGFVEGHTYTGGKIVLEFTGVSATVSNNTVTVTWRNT